MMNMMKIIKVCVFLSLYTLIKSRNKVRARFRNNLKIWSSNGVRIKLMFRWDLNKTFYKVVLVVLGDFSTDYISLYLS